MKSNSHKFFFKFRILKNWVLDFLLSISNVILITGEVNAGNQLISRYCNERFALTSL